MKKIEKIIIQHMPDNDADLSHLGEFSDEAKAGAIDHHERDGITRNMLKYFNPQDPEHAEADYIRMIEYDRGNWYMLGIKAVAEIRTSDDGKTWSINRISSGGLWGIESDGGPFNEIEAEQRDELEDILKNLGFTAKEIKEAPVYWEDK